MSVLLYFILKMAIEDKLPERVQEIIANRNTLIPLLMPDTIATKAAVSTYLDEDSRARKTNFEEIHSMLAKYGLSIHAALTDLLIHPDQILLRTRGGSIQAAISSNNTDYLYHLAIRTQKLEKDRRRELICKNALFCLAPVSTLKFGEFFYFDYQGRRNSAAGVYAEIDFRLPSFSHDTIAFQFDKKGAVEHLFFHSGRSYDHIFWLETLPSGFQINEASFPDEHHAYLDPAPLYRYCPNDNSLRREPVTQSTPTLVEEIATILGKIPMPLINYDPLSQITGS